MARVNEDLVVLSNYQLESLEEGDLIELEDGTEVEISDFDQEGGAYGVDQDGNEYAIVSEDLLDEDLLDEEVIPISQDDFDELEEGDEVELDDGKMLKVTKVSETSVAAEDKDGNQYELVPEGEDSPTSSAEMEGLDEGLMRQIGHSYKGWKQEKKGRHFNRMANRRYWVANKILKPKFLRWSKNIWKRKADRYRDRGNAYLHASKAHRELAFDTSSRRIHKYKTAARMNRVMSNYHGIRSGRFNRYANRNEDVEQQFVLDAEDFNTTRLGDILELERGLQAEVVNFGDDYLVAEDNKGNEYVVECDYKKKM